MRCEGSRLVLKEIPGVVVASACRATNSKEIAGAPRMVFTRSNISTSVAATAE